MPGDTEDQIGISQLLKEGDQSCHKGRAVTVVSHVPPQDHSVLQRLVFPEGEETEKEDPCT